MERALPEWSSRGGFDLEAIEFAVRDSLQRVGARFLEQLLNTDWEGSSRGWVPCDQQHVSRHVGKREKTVLTVVGEIHLDREYYHAEL